MASGLICNLKLQYRDALFWEYYGGYEERIELPLQMAKKITELLIIRLNNFGLIVLIYSKHHQLVDSRLGRNLS